VTLRLEPELACAAVALHCVLLGLINVRRLPAIAAAAGPLFSANAMVTLEVLALSITHNHARRARLGGNDHERLEALGTDKAAVMPTASFFGHGGTG